MKNYEPLSALSDNSDGFTFYRKIFELAVKTSHPVTILIEIGDGKKDNVEELVKKNGFENYVFYKDLINIYRALLLTKS